jgi:hypothetical protein
MLLTEYLLETEFSKQSEIRRSLLISFYNYRVNEIKSFTIKQISDWLVELGYAKPSSARLRNNLKKSKMFLASGNGDSFKIHPSTVETLDSEYPNLAKKTEEVISYDSIIPESLLQKERSFIKQLIKQINASYENNIFDGCAVLMRRLLEILLILSYQEAKIESSIQDRNGDFKQLSAIIDDAKKTLLLNCRATHVII